jgi:hypothetical protein
VKWLKFDITVQVYRIDGLKYLFADSVSFFHLTPQPLKPRFHIFLIVFVFLIVYFRPLSDLVEHNDALVAIRYAFHVNHII